MADHPTHPTTVRGIDYKATFPFVHLFKAFRLAIDPSKIVLALVLLLLVYGGGRLLDAVWPDKHRAVRGELEAYAIEPLARPDARGDGVTPASPRAAFREFRDEQIQLRSAEIRRQLTLLGHPDFDPDYDGLVTALRMKRDAAVDAAKRDYDTNGKSQPDAARFRDERIETARATYTADVRAAKHLKSEGLFIHFLRFEIERADGVVFAAVHFNFGDVFLGLTDLFFTAPAWAFRHHAVYFSIFFIWLLLLWSIFGGALSRIAAVQVAREEKISVRQSLRFGTGKVLSFLFAPLIPLIIIGVLGLLLGVASFLISVPGIGGIWSIVVGAGFFLALLAGLVMMLTAVGLIGGGHLMYPTIAAEGSDSFDAVSRSFSYLYARPWQLAFYALVSLVYGAITYLVVRLALFILLLLVHGSVSLFQWQHAADGTPIIDAMWPRPVHFMDLDFETRYAALGPVQSVGAALIACWIYFTISILGAYVISLYVSSSTLIYFLLRRDVDATDLDEVYLEPNDEELTEAAVTTEAALSPETPVAGAEPAGQPVDVPAPPQA